MNNEQKIQHTAQDAGKLAGLLEQITPGPWEACGLHVCNPEPERKCFGSSPIRHWHRPVAQITWSQLEEVDYHIDRDKGDDRLPGWAEAEANARLIALAPQLAASLIETVAALEAMLDASGDYAATMARDGRGHAGLVPWAQSDTPRGQAIAALANARKVTGEGGVG